MLQNHNLSLTKEYISQISELVGTFAKSKEDTWIIVLDKKNCIWSQKCIGMPSVIKFGKRLAIFYDALGGESISHMGRDLDLAWLMLPLMLPK